MNARARVTAIVLSDHAPDASVRTALAAREYAARVLVAERNREAAVAERALPSDVSMVACDWSNDDAAVALLAAVETPWVLFLSPGEGLACDDPGALAKELASLTPGAVELSTGSRAETRLHPPGAEALAAVGGPGTSRLRNLRIHALPREPLSAPAAVAPEPAPIRDLLGDLPPAVRDIAGLRGALRGEDLPALEHLLMALEHHEEKRLLEIARDGRDVCWTDENETEPLVTIRVATYHRPEWIARAIESCLAQTYERVEVLVVGDCCTPETAAIVRGFHDSRLRFENLPARGLYPTERMARWRVAGTVPANAALLLARGAWITACDDDDEFTPDHVEVLLREARARRLEMVYSRANMEVHAGRWELLGSPPLREGHVTQGSVLYSLGLRFLRFSTTCWRREQPADWNLWSRMEAIGVRTGFVDAVTYLHRLETHKRDQL